MTWAVRVSSFEFLVSSRGQGNRVSGLEFGVSSRQNAEGRAAGMADGIWPSGVQRPGIAGNLS